MIKWVLMKKKKVTPKIYNAFTNKVNKKYFLTKSDGITEAEYDLFPEDLQVYLDLVYISDGSIQVTPRQDLQPHVMDFARKKCDVINDFMAGKSEEPIRAKKDSKEKFKIKTKNKSPVYVYAPKQVDNSVHYHSHLHNRPVTRSGLHNRPPTGLQRPEIDHHSTGTEGSGQKGNK